MTDMMKTAAILASGGDAPGMNAAVRALVRIGGNRHGWGILGIKDGYKGLVRTCDRLARGELSLEILKSEITAYAGMAGLMRPSQDLVRMSQASVCGLAGRGGTILGSGRCDRFRDPAVRRRAIDLLAQLGVTALVVVVGDGSLAGAARLAAESEGDLTAVAVPATIDNDVHCTDRTLGFDTALGHVISAAERFHDTTEIHHRIVVLETVGRHCGHLTLEAGLAGGVEIVVIPEQGPLSGRKMLGIARRLEEVMDHGQNQPIVLIAEGVTLTPPMTGRAAHALAAFLAGFFHRANSPYPELEVCESVVGHVQGDGSPSTFDRTLAVRSAAAAWEAITAEPPHSGVVGWRLGRFAWSGFEAPAATEPQDEARRDDLPETTVSWWPVPGERRRIGEHPVSTCTSPCTIPNEEPRP